MNVFKPRNHLLHKLEILAFKQGPDKIKGTLKIVYG